MTNNPPATVPPGFVAVEQAGEADAGPDASPATHEAA
jgi:hypothetical protein